MSFQDKIRQVFGWPNKSRPAVSQRSKALANEPVSAASMYESYANEVDVHRKTRLEKYEIFDAMDDLADVSSVLDAYAEDATQLDAAKKKTIWVETKDRKIQEELDQLLYKVLHIEDWVEGSCRDVAKYGDDFAQVHANSTDGVTGITWRNPRDIERIENKEGILIGFEETKYLQEYKRKVDSELKQKKDGSAVPTSYAPWDIAHFRIFRRKMLSKSKAPNVYGTSILAGSERVAKQTKILDDMLMIMRLTRSLDRQIYYVDTGRSPVEEEVAILKRWRRALKRSTYMDPTAGRFDSRFDPLAWSADIFWPTKEGANSRIETQQGLTNVSDIVDIDHFRDKFFGSLRAPKAYFGYEGDINSKASLSNQSIKWSRAVVSIQRAVKQGVTRLCQIHLAYRGIDAAADKFEVMMTAPSIAELIDKLESWQQVIDVAERMSGLGDTLGLDKKDWTVYILENVLWLSKQEIKKFVRKLDTENAEPPPEAPKEPRDKKDDGGEPEKPKEEPSDDQGVDKNDQPDSDTEKEDYSKYNGLSQTLLEVDDLIERIKEVQYTQINVED